MQTYTTRSGDTWDLIAFDALGSEMYADKLIETNPMHMQTSIFSAGVVLTLPEIDTSEIVRTLPPWRKP